ncbi:nitrilase-related carbon-nitrogen hydrolase [Paraburkholderia sp. BCC1885]|uniref:nitrilase-related carbon-nitrogen hydrolase n=1 Tax=Paraburkholderia sp. BCC1885 TaxID=2562669 RepID=UPI001182AC58|nr:nitrilase-related carbon-nitrogen hydrolase [Paraburkholderia sp. BCC1885]
MSSLSVPTLRVASIPLRSCRGEAARNVARVGQWLERAARESIGLVVFPEICLAGYGSLAKLHRDELEALAEPLDGPSLRAVTRAVEQTGVAAGVGLIERAPDGRLFNSYVVCMPGGGRHYHRKLHAFEHRRVVSGDRFTVFDTVWRIRIGVLIGGDAYLVENVRMTALLGATLLVVPHRSYAVRPGGDMTLQPVSAEQWRKRDTAGEAAHIKGAGDKDSAIDWLRASLPARAADNGMFVTLSNGIDMITTEAAEGAGMIVDPCGRVLAESARTGACLSEENDEINEEFEILSAEIDPRLSDASAGRQWLKARRPDLYAPLGQTDHAAANFEPRNVSARGSIAVSFAQVARNRLPR